MHDFDDDPLDLLEDDGDGVIETILMEDGDKEQPSSPRGSSGCCVVLLGIGASVGSGWWVVGNLLI